MLETLRLLRDLVAIPSVNPMGRPLSGPDIYEHRVTAYLEEFFRSLGVPFERQAVAPLRDNIVAVCDLPGSGPTLIFEAHQDTVPTDQMTIPPFGASIEAGRLYGRGACDIKGGMASMLAAFARTVREKPAGGARRVVMACTVDEEFTFLGVQRLAKTDFRPESVGAVFAVVAEPTQLQIVNTHKGAVRWVLTTTGKACHSSRPELGVNAIYHMARLLPAVERYAEEVRASRTDPRLGTPTLSVGMIAGGTSVNTVPDRCSVEIDRRLLPGEKPADAQQHFLARLRERVEPDIAFECPPPFLAAPALSPDGSAELVARLGAAIDGVTGGHQVIAVPYGTDAASLAEAGVPSVVFGPGDIARGAHQGRMGAAGRGGASLRDSVPVGQGWLRNADENNVRANRMQVLGAGFRTVTVVVWTGSTLQPAHRKRGSEPCPIGFAGPAWSKRSRCLHCLAVSCRHAPPTPNTTTTRSGRFSLATAWSATVGRSRREIFAWIGSLRSLKTRPIGNAG